MSYKEKYEEAMKNYQRMRGEYEDRIQSERYAKIELTRPFDFLRAKQLCETLKLYKDLGKKPMMSFGSPDEVALLYRNMLFFKRNTAYVDALMEDVSYVAEIKSRADDINSFVNENPYLGNALCVKTNQEITSLAEQCLEMLPEYSSLMTKAFRYNLLESAVASLSIEGLKELCNKKVFAKNDMDSISMISDIPGYNEKIRELCAYLGHSEPVLATFDIKLKGVTFPNADGSSRQENLKALDNYVKAHAGEVVSLTAERYIYTPPIGAPEPACRIIWNGREIGNLPADVAKDLHERYENANTSAVLDKIIGGGEGMSYGCNIKLSVGASKDKQVETPAIEEHDER